MPPVIVVGCHRSGTSLFAELLSRQGVFMGADLRKHFESDLFFQMNEYLLEKAQVTWADPFGHDRYLEEENNVQAFRDHWQHFWDTQGKKAYWGYRIYYPGKFRDQKKWGWKEPRTSLWLDLWLQLFENAKVIHIVKNGVQVANSINSREKKRKPQDYLYESNAEKFLYAFKLWEYYEDAILKSTRSLDETRYQKIRYEDLILRPEKVMMDVCDFVGNKYRKRSYDHLDRSKVDVQVKDLTSESIDYINQSRYMEMHKYSYQ